MSLKRKSSNTNRTSKRGNGHSIGKIMLLFMSMILLSGFWPAEVSAHPPKKVTLVYDAAAKVLKVTILHSSFSLSWHYIKTITVTKNKKNLASYSYTSQPGDEFTYTYDIPALPGDTLVITAYCSMYGDRIESLTIPAAKKAS